MSTTPSDLGLHGGRHRWQRVDDPRPGGDGTGFGVVSNGAVTCGLTCGFLPSLVVRCERLLDGLLSFCCLRSSSRWEAAALTAAGESR